MRILNVQTKASQLRVAVLACLTLWIVTLDNERIYSALDHTKM
jgi:hypothetical protein